MSGRVEAIWLKKGRRGPMESSAQVDAITGRGLAGNANQGGRRQVTVLSAEAWEEATADLGRTLDPALRRANLLVRGIELAESRGRVLLVGTVEIAIRGETRPCGLMDQAWPGLRKSLEQGWRGGAYGKILAGGRIAVGDEVRWADAVEPGG